jgi:hypothetical protein
MSRRTLLLARRPLPLSLLRRVHEREGVGVGGSDFAALTRTICGQSIKRINNSENWRNWE